MTTNLHTFPTRNTNSENNGVLVPIWHIDSGRPVQQVYVTTILPGMSKGPHLHHHRAGAFTVLVGRVLIVTREDGVYKQHVCGQGFKTVHVAPGTPCALYNIGSEPAMVLNCPSAPWRDNSDEWPVEGWDYEVGR
jgi:mannose-6-phosphate isomerase-like protein (cupin superfamily)